MEREREVERETKGDDEFLKPNMRKLALWNTRNYRPIMTHDELEPIMATLGFVGLEPVLSSGEEGEEPVYWKEYMHPAAASLLSKYHKGSMTRMVPLTKPRLPYPNIDGFHKEFYLIFYNDVEFYLSSGTHPSSYFLITEMPISWPQDLEWKWRIMETTDEYLVCKTLGIKDPVLRKSMTYYNDKMLKMSKNEKEEADDDLLLRTFAHLDDIIVPPENRDDVEK